jgi:hypothetical protein
MTVEYYQYGININPYLTLYRLPGLFTGWRLYDDYRQMWVDISDRDVDALISAISVHVKESV